MGSVYFGAVGKRIWKTDLQIRSYPELDPIAIGFRVPLENGSPDPFIPRNWTR